MKQYYQQFWPTLFIIVISFFADFLVTVLTYQHFIHASCITFCLLLWYNTSTVLRIISGSVTVLSYFFSGSCCSLELLSIIIPIIVIYGLKPVLNDGDWVKVIIILMVLKIKNLLTGISFTLMSPWTFFGIIANIIIIVWILKYMRGRRAIA